MKVDEDRRKFFELNHPQQTKTTKPSLHRKEYTSVKIERIYEKGGDNCPYKAMEEYLKKIGDTETDVLFPKPKNKVVGDQWYQKKQVLG